MAAQAPIPVVFLRAVTSQTLGAGTWITGGIFCSNGRILMADRGNNRLVQLDNQYRFVNEYKIDGYPTDIAVGNNDELYIAVNCRDIYKCTLDAGGLTIVSIIQGPNDTLGITVIDDNIIVGTHTAVMTLQWDGTVVRSVPRSGYIHSYVATSPSQQTICHTDDNGIVCRSLGGEELFRYNDQQLKDPAGICVDRRNNLYVCGYDSHNVHQVSLDTRSGRIIVGTLHSIERPYAVMFHPQRDELIVTSRGENTVFEVYK